MNLSYFDKYSKTAAFAKFKRPLYKYYPRFSKFAKKFPNLKDFLSIDKLLKNANVSE